jgi:TonB family protein
MRWSGINGNVLVGFVVDVHGNVQDPVVLTSNNPGFEDAAIRAVSQWKFKPATVNGKPVNTSLRVPIVFRMGDLPGPARDEYDITRKSGKAAPPILRTVRVPVYPYELRRDGVTGRVKAVMTVDTAGKVAKIEITESTRPEFSQALIAALEGFMYSPALKDGVPVASGVIYEQTFDDADLADPASVDLLALEKLHPDSIRRLTDLDAIPKPVSRRAPLFPRSIPAGVTAGDATVEFLIDSDGHARLPRVISASDPAFGYAAVEAVASWIFDPPTLHGHEAVARAEIPFKFKLRRPGE